MINKLQLQKNYATYVFKHSQGSYSLKEMEIMLQNAIEWACEQIGINNSNWWQHTNKDIFKDLVAIVSNNKSLEDYIFDELLKSLY